MQEMAMDFQGIGSGVRRGAKEEGPRPTLWKQGPQAPSAPSAKLSLGGLRPRRARFRFARRRDDSPEGQQEQGQCQVRGRRRQKCSEEMGVFGLDNGVHHRVSVGDS